MRKLIALPFERSYETDWEKLIDPDDIVAITTFSKTQCEITLSGGAEFTVKGTIAEVYSHILIEGLKTDAELVYENTGARLTVG